MTEARSSRKQTLSGGRNSFVTGAGRLPESEIQSS